MSKKEATIPADLATMVGLGEGFVAQGKSYKVKPIMLAHVGLFMKDNLSIGTQLFNISNDKARQKVDKWLSEVTVEVAGKKVTAHYCLDENDEPISVEKAMADGWDVEDLKNYFRKLCDISG